MASVPSATVPSLVAIKYRNHEFKLTVYKGITTAEINSAIKSKARLTSPTTNVVGLEDKQKHVVYPLTLLSLEPSYFPVSTTFSLLLEESSHLSPALFSKKIRFAPHSQDRKSLDGDEGEPEECDEEEDDEEEELKSASTSQTKSRKGEGGSAASTKSSGPLKVEQAEADIPDNLIKTSAGMEPILEYIQQNTAFSRIPMNEILAVFREAATEKGVIDRITFESCFSKVCNTASSRAAREKNRKKKASGQDPEEEAEQEQRVLKLVANRIFDVFDRDGNGLVDHSEFVAGLSLLCRASSDDKIRAAFNLFDLDGDGWVTYDEMLRYMISFFEVCFALDSNMKKRFGNITAEQVGTATASHCFVRADVNNDGRISLDEFRTWCNSDDSVAKSGIIPQHSF